MRNDDAADATYPSESLTNLSFFAWPVKPRLADHYRILRAMPTRTMHLCIRRTVWRRMVHSEVSETWSVHLPTRNTPKTSAGAACIRAWRRRKPKKDQNSRDLYHLQSAAIPFRQKLPKPLCIVFTHPNPRTLINRSTYSRPLHNKLIQTCNFTLKYLPRSLRSQLRVSLQEKDEPDLSVHHGFKAIPVLRIFKPEDIPFRLAPYLRMPLCHAYILYCR